MGVQKLMSHIKQQGDRAINYVDLVQIAKGYHGRMNILMDFYCWENYVRQKILQSLGPDMDGSHLKYAGGEYQLMDDCMKCLIQELRNANIEPVFYLDGAKGTSVATSDKKFQTWKKRLVEAKYNIETVNNFLSGQGPLHNKVRSDLPLPCLQEVQAALTLKEMKCEMKIKVSGEADDLIARDLIQNKQAYGVFSGDTDFVIFPNGVLLAQEFFDKNCELGKDLHTFKPGTPKNLLCGVFRSENIMQLLKLPDHNSLVELAIIAGNDFTTPCLAENVIFDSSFSGNYDKLSQTILKAKSHRVEDCEFFGQLMNEDENFRQAVQYSRQFYNLSLMDEDESEMSETFKLISEDIRKGVIPSAVISMHQGIYWHKQVLGTQSPDRALTGLRAYIYTIVLPEEIQCVEETMLDDKKRIKEIPVEKMYDKEVPSFVQLKKNNLSSESKFKIFEYIIWHQECGQDEDDQISETDYSSDRERSPIRPGTSETENSYFELFGYHRGFVALLLRYFLTLNWEQNLSLRPEEFYVMAAWTLLGSHDVSQYRELKILPSPRCLTLNSSIQALYRTAYAFLGNILAVSHNFPSPKDLFSFSTLVAFQTAAFIKHRNAARYIHPDHGASDEEMHLARHRIRDIIKTNGEMVMKIIDGFFPFDVNFLN